MHRRTLARRNALLTLAQEPWTLFETDPNNPGGGGGAPVVNEHGYPDNTPWRDMSAEHQAAYWQHHSKKWETAAKAAPTAEELTRLRDRDTALKAIEDQNLTDAQRADQERQSLTQERDTATSTVGTLTDENTRLKVALEKGLTIAQANRLSGSTKEELEADADAYLAEIGQTGSGNGQGNGAGTQQRSGGNRGSDVGSGAKTVTAGADLYRQRHAKN
ncbi:hypothetical protein AB0F77_40045 [Streptomyces sp. NPDC026672]|uniref:hypothetical protein n=1 Tax=Actinomycetes TaxID=1760 RepID=UPI0033CADF7E